MQPITRNDQMQEAEATSPINFSACISKSQKNF